MAAERTRFLCGCYRKGQADDPEVYVAAVATVLAAYPEDIVRRVTHPLYGLPSEGDWLPTIHEVKAACERLMGPLRAAEKRERASCETARLLAPPAKPAGPIERERALAKWEDTKAELRGRSTKEVERVEAERRLPELYRETCGKPVSVSEQLSARLKTMMESEQ